MKNLKPKNKCTYLNISKYIKILIMLKHWSKYKFKIDLKCKNRPIIKAHLRWQVTLYCSPGPPLVGCKRLAELPNHESKPRSWLRWEQSRENTSKVKQLTQTKRAWGNKRVREREKKRTLLSIMIARKERETEKQLG